MYYIRVIFLYDIKLRKVFITSSAFVKHISIIPVSYFFSILCPLFLFWIAVGGYGQRQKGQPCWGTLPGPEHLLSRKEHAHTPPHRSLQGCQEWPWGQNNQFTELPFLLYYCINMKQLSFFLTFWWLAELNPFSDVFCVAQVSI